MFAAVVNPTLNPDKTCCQPNPMCPMITLKCVVVVLISVRWQHPAAGRRWTPGEDFLHTSSTLTAARPEPCAAIKRPAPSQHRPLNACAFHCSSCSSAYRRRDLVVLQPGPPPASLCPLPPPLRLKGAEGRWLPVTGKSVTDSGEGGDATQSLELYRLDGVRHAVETSHMLLDSSAACMYELGF